MTTETAMVTTFLMETELGGDWCQAWEENNFYTISDNLEYIVYLELGQIHLPGTFPRIDVLCTSRWNIK